MSRLCWPKTPVFTDSADFWHHTGLDPIVGLVVHHLPGGDDHIEKGCDHNKREGQGAYRDSRFRAEDHTGARHAGERVPQHGGIQGGRQLPVDVRCWCKRRLSLHGEA